MKIERGAAALAYAPHLVFADVDIAVGYEHAAFQCPWRAFFTVEGLVVFHGVAQGKNETPSIVAKALAITRAEFMAPLLREVVVHAFGGKARDPAFLAERIFRFQIDAAADRIGIH